MNSRGQQAIFDNRLTRNKYRAVKVKLDGHTFDSKREAAWYAQLRLLEKSGEIEKLMVHFPYTLNAYGGEKIGSYEADFVYVDKRDGKTHVVDVKGVDTALSRWKRKHVAAQYKIAVEVVK